MDVGIVQALLGYAKLEITAYYTQVARRSCYVTSPLDQLATPAKKARTSSGWEGMRASIEVADICRAAAPAY